MTGAYAASYLPVCFVPLMALSFFVVLGLLFTYIEADA